MIGIIHIEDGTFITDRDNAVRIPVERVEVRPTWDIDRSGSKGQVSVTADAGVLEPGMWLSTYRTIAPERGPVIRYPRGHWHLSRPGIAYPGGHEMDTGNVAVMQTASGSDIVDDIAGVLLTEPFYTPPKGHIMTDVHNLLKMATCGIIGPNLLPNGSFEDGGANWNIAFLNGGTGSNLFVGSTSEMPYPAPHGEKYWRPQFNANMPSSAYVRAYQQISIPAGTEFMMASAVAMDRGTPVMEIDLSFLDVNNARIDGAISPANRSIFDVWVRHMVFAEVPPEAVFARLDLRTRYAQAGPAWTEFGGWDDVQLRTCTMRPLPDDRFTLPASDAVASTRIQTAAGKSIGYDAINADRLNPISHYAIATDMDGRLTTRPMRTLADAMPQYTFGPDDLALIGDIEIPATSVRPHNHWMAIKEDFENASASLRADSYNNNANDPFSVANSGSVYSAPPITVQDAVDQAALQAIADRARDTYSMNETVRFACMPLPDLDVYSVIAIDDPDMPHVSGKWAVNSIDASGDYLVITATRAVSREV